MRLALKAGWKGPQCISLSFSGQRNTTTCLVAICTSIAFLALSVRILPSYNKSSLRAVFNIFNCHLNFIVYNSLVLKRNCRYQA